MARAPVHAALVHIWNKESTQIEGTEPLDRSLGKCPGMQVKIWVDGIVDG